MSPIATTNTSICETSNIFTGGGPGDQGALVEVNGQQFIPSPFINISLEKYKMDNIIIGGVMKITLNGVVVDSNFTGVTGELLQILGANVGANSDCVNIKINCGGTFIDGWGRILSVNISEGQQPTWVNLAPYSIEIELYENNGGPVVYPDASINLENTNTLLLSNLEENFTLSINEDSFNWDVVNGLSDLLVDGVGNRHIAVNFTITAAGINGCSSGSSLLYGLEAAETAIQDRISYLQNGSINMLNSFQATNLPSDIDVYMNGDKYLQLRNITVNTMSNSISVEGNLIVRPSGCSWSNVFTTINVSESVDTEGNDISIAGTITGLVNMNYSNIIADTNNKTLNCAFNEKMSAAESFLAIIHDDNVLKNIALAHVSEEYILDNCIITGTGNTPCGSISPDTSVDLCDFRITTTDIDRQYADGTINFSFVLSNKNSCNIPGANKVDIEVTTDKPHDNIVEILIPGRGNSGPIIQNLCCKSSRKITYSLTATLNKTRCAWNNTATIDSIRQCAEAILDQYKQDSDTTCWFVVSDQETTGNNTYRLTQEFVEPTLP